MALLGTSFHSLASDTQSEAIGPLGTVVVTATRQPQRVNESIANVTIIDRSEIEAAGPSTSLGELISRTVGVEMSRSGGPGTDESIFIRGANSGHTLVLLDGVRVGSATFGTTSIQAIPLSQIERIEILRGPASAVYGSDAIGGVVQIFTKAGRDAPKLSVEAGAGNYGAYETSVAHANTVDGLTYNVKLGAKGATGINAITSPSYPGYNPDRDGYWNRNASLNAAYKFDRNLEVGGGYFVSKSENRYDAFQSLPPTYVSVNAGLDYKMKREVSEANVYAKVSPLANWNSTVRLAQGIDRDESPESVVGDPLSIFKTTQDQFSWQNDIRLPVGQALVLLERLEQKVGSTKDYSQKSRTIDALALGWSGTIGDNNFQANWRTDDNSQFGQHDTYMLGYGYWLTPAWRLAASYGTGFKAPTMNDLYFPTTPGVGGGNAALKPEESTNREVSLRYEAGMTHGAITYFDNEIRNLIDWATDPVTYFSSPSNVGKARINGWELSLGTVLGSWELKGNLTLQDPRDETTQEQLRRRAKQFGTISAAYVSGDLKVGGELQGVGRRYDDPHWMTGLNQVHMHGYSLFNVFANYRVSRSWQAFARVDNVFDREYEVARSRTVTYGVPGTTAFAGLRYTFQ